MAGNPPLGEVYERDEMSYEKVSLNLFLTQTPVLHPSWKENFWILEHGA